MGETTTPDETTPDQTSTLFWDPRCQGHTVPSGFPEVPQRLAGAVPYLEARGWALCDMTGSGPADAAGGMRAQARRLAEAVHDPVYIERMEAAFAEGVELLDSADNPISAGTAPASWAAVEAALASGDRVMTVAGSQAFSLTRPPGHHCERDHAMGFCYLNQVAILAQGLLQVHGAERIAILDFDVHHGNGTQHLFDRRADVLYASVHQHPFYPGTGAAAETGVGAGAGTTVNAPLPAGSGDEVYRQVFDDRLLPAIRTFRPDVLLVSAGFDAWRQDPLGGMVVTEQGFHAMGVALTELAQELCQGRLVSVLEGGYDLQALPRLIEIYLSGTVGRALE